MKMLNFRLLCQLLVSGIFSIAGEKIGCLPTEFRCSSGQCVDGGRYCDGYSDCFDGSDEPERCTNCNRTYYGLQDVKYPLRLSERRSPSCTLTFAAAGGKYGDSVEITFLSFQIGTFDLDSSSCLKGYMEIEEMGSSKKDKFPSRARRRTRKKGIPRRKAPILKSASGSFCGPLVGPSATYYSKRDMVKLTVFVPPLAAAGQPSVPRLYLTYRFLKQHDPSVDYSLGDLVEGSSCDRLFTNCLLQNCVIRSPNFPGFYLRNMSCNYMIRQDSIPQEDIAQIEIFQENEFKINIPSGHTNNDRYKPGTLTSECSGDTIKIFDGGTSKSSVLVEFCGAGPLAAIRSSGPVILVNLVSAPSQTLVNTRFELIVKIKILKKSSTFHATEGCSVTVDGAQYPVGIIRAPDHSVPSGTTCTYRVVGKRPTDRVWLYFASYHIPDFHPWTESESCDVGKLEILNPIPKLRHSHHYGHANQLVSPLLENQLTNVQTSNSETFCEKKSPRQCGHASDYPDLIPSRPCSFPHESYLSLGPEIVLKMTYLSSTSIKGSGNQYFTARYEIVETMPYDNEVLSNPCVMTIDSQKSHKGFLESPKNVFLYGRGGAKDLVCSYELRGSIKQKVRITVKHIYFSNTVLCQNIYDPVVERHKCNIFHFGKFAVLNITELWHDSRVFVGCVCDTIDGFVLESVGHMVDVEFLVRNMGPKDDFRTFRFTIAYEFVPTSSACETSPTAGTQVMSGSAGELVLIHQNGLPFKCRWLLAALPSRALFITVNGRMFETDCQNKILLYNVNSWEPYRVFCPDEDHQESFFTTSWKLDSNRNIDADLTFLEFIANEPGQFRVNWIEVSRVSSEHCSLECPELEACISEDLACDEIQHCPTSANDEKPDRCNQLPMMTIAISSTCAMALVTIIILVALARYKFVHSLDKTVIPPPDMYRNDYKHKKVPVR